MSSISNLRWDPCTRATWAERRPRNATMLTLEKAPKWPSRGHPQNDQWVKVPFIWTPFAVLTQSPYHQHTHVNLCNSQALTQAHPISVQTRSFKVFYQRKQGPPTCQAKCKGLCLSHLSCLSVRARWGGTLLLPLSHVANEENEKWIGEITFSKSFSLSRVCIQCLLPQVIMWPTNGQKTSSQQSKLRRASEKGKVTSSKQALERQSLCIWLCKTSGHTGSVFQSLSLSFVAKLFQG